MLISTFHCTECGKPFRGSAGLGLCGACVLRGAIDFQNPHRGEDATNEPGGPTRFGDYDLLEELARGGMGVVYRARQRSLDRVVALKVLLGGAFAGEDGRRRLRAEAEAAGRLQHPNIVAIHDAGVIDGQPFFSMAMVEGPTLADLVRTGTFTPARAARCVARIAEAVHHAHTQGVLHRDLKPSNVLLDAEDEPHVTDFGLAKQLAPGTQSITVNSHLTLTGQVLGSPAYMAPEQATGRNAELGPASDVYSLGAILYELLTGRPPFLGETPQAVIEQVKALDPIPVRRLKSGIPADLETVCLKCLEKEPRRRYASARELAEELTRFLNGEPVRAHAVGPAGRLIRMAWRRPWPAAAVVLAAAMFVSVGFALAWKARTERLHSIALLKEQAATRLAMMHSQLGEARALIRNRQADSRPRAEAILGRMLEENPPAELRAQARDLALAALALPSARTEPLLGEGVLSEDWTLAVGDLPRERWALATFRGRIVLRPIDAATNILEFSTAPRVVSALIAFSPGGRWLAIRHRDELGVWDTTPGATQRLAFVTKAWGNGSAFGFGKTAFVPGDGAVLWLEKSSVVASALPDGREPVRWRDVGGREIKGEAVTFAPDGKSFVVARSDMPVIEIRTWPSGRMERAVSKRSSRAVSALAFSASTGRIAVGDAAGRITVFQSDGGPAPLFEFTGHAEGIRALHFADDGRHLCSTSEDETLRLWDCVTGAEVAALPFEAGAMSFSRDGQLMGVGSTGGKLSMVRLEHSPILRRFRPDASPSTPQMLSFHPDGRSLFCLAEGGAMRCSVPTGTALTFYPAPGARNVLADAGDDGGLIITSDAGVKRHSLADPTAGTTIVPGSDFGWGGPMSSADGRWLAACNKSLGRTAVWPAGARDGSRVKFLSGGSGGGEAALSPDGSRVAVNHHYAEDVIVFDVARGSVVTNLPLPARHAIAWSTDGRWLAGIGTTFRLWDAASWKLVALPALEQNVAAFTAVAFSWPDRDGRSQYLAATTGSSRIALIDLATRTIVATLEAPQARAIYKLSFSRDNRWLAAAVSGGEIQLWDVPVIQSRLESGSFGSGLR